jgi:sugar O-acyltransferase (sialic acid O-acetyltransferase NeuD family)
MHRRRRERAVTRWIPHLRRAFLDRIQHLGGRMAQVVVFGTGQWAELAHFYLTHDSAHSVVGFTVDAEYLSADTFKEKPVVAFAEIEKHFPPEQFRLFIPIGFAEMNHVRAARYYEAKQKGYELISYVSSKATTWPGFTCGDNCFILEDNTIQPFATVGNNVVIWSGNHIGHHSVIRDHVLITSQVAIAGGCTIEEFCFIGANSTIRDQTVLARETLVGMSVAIQSDTKEFELYRAPDLAPARVRSDEILAISHKSKS